MPRKHEWPTNIFNVQFVKRSTLSGALPLFRHEDKSYSGNLALPAAFIVKEQSLSASFCVFLRLPLI